MRVAILGAGSWGTAFAQIAADAGNDVSIWGRTAQTVDEINADHHNFKFHPENMLPQSINASTDAQKVLKDADVVVLAIPAQTLRQNLSDWGSSIPSSAFILSLLKGIEVGTLERMSQVTTEVLGINAERVSVLTGPNLAGEIIRREPAASVIACSNETNAHHLQDMCATPYFRPYTSTDVIGCELAGSIKNVMALAVGMAIGLGMGDNTKATVITRGLAETARLGVAMGADPSTIAGLAGMGDLVATCSSPLSRNRSVGELLGRGSTMEQARAKTKTTAEGVSSAPAVLALAKKFQVDMPIVEAVVDVVQNSLPPAEVVKRLMNRTTRS
ncbi:MAG: NAD(P)-dependent glycerol-3-phosphate dehydrogenase, partial [Actinobacteria bacterium]|nr:NAD(P)-dependent glycerol-3-phosphate dehydrogenase [Actinomycetota bacterium]